MAYRLPFTPASPFVQRLVSRQFGRSDLGRMARLARNPAARRAVMRFLAAMGPGGSLIRSLIDPNQPGPKVQRQLRQAAAMIEAFGGEVLPGTNATVADITSGIEASISNLQRRELSGPARSAGPPAGASFRCPGASRGPCESTGSTTPPQPSCDFRPIRAGPNSSNVYEFGYDIDNHYLYVRYQEPHEHAAPRQALGRSIGTRPSNPTSSLRFTTPAARGSGYGTTCASAARSAATSTGGNWWA